MTNPPTKRLPRTPTPLCAECILQQEWISIIDRLYILVDTAAECAHCNDQGEADE